MMDTKFPLSSALQDTATLVCATLDAVLPRTSSDANVRLYDAMRYSTLSGGKYFRAFLTLASADLFQVDRVFSSRVAAAIEIIHSYSLIHDDLPAMDDDAMRRGKPSCHIAYDEATAILAGDGLLTLAFEILSDPATHPDATIRGALVCAIAKAAGPQGMVGGQMIDLEADHTLTLEGILHLHRWKTGKMFAASCAAGPILGQATPEDTAALAQFGETLGLAFQIRDDLLDLDADRAAPQDAFHALRPNLVTLSSPEFARDLFRRCINDAIDSLVLFGQRAEPLIAFAEYLAHSVSLS